MKRFFTFLMAVWALLSISQTVKAADDSSSSTTPTGNFAKFYLIGNMNDWDQTNTDYPFTTTDGVNYTCTFPGQSGIDGKLYFNPKGFYADGTAIPKMLGPTVDTKITANFQEVVYGDKAWFIQDASSDKTYTITLQYNGTQSNPQIKYSEGGAEVTKKVIKLFDGTSEVTGSNGKYTLDLSSATSDAAITLTIDGTNYGLTTAQTIAAASTSNFAFTTTGTSALTLAKGLVYSLTVTEDGKMTVVAEEKVVPYSIAGAGFYLVGDFMSQYNDKTVNPGGDTPGTINYERLYFKFDEQKDGSYKIVIPACLTAKMQILGISVDGVPQVYGPAGIVKLHGAKDDGTASPVTNGSVGGNDTDKLETVEGFDDSNNYWNLVTRNDKVTDDDGSYVVSFKFDKKTLSPTTWTIQHDGRTRVTYLLSTAKEATAQPLYDTLDEHGHYSNKHYAAIHLDGSNRYFVLGTVVSNLDTEGIKVQAEKANDGIHIINDGNGCGTHDKMFFLGAEPKYDTDNSTVIAQSSNKLYGNQPAVALPNIKGTKIVEVNPNKGINEDAKKDKSYGLQAEIYIPNMYVIDYPDAISMVGPAIPSTTTIDGGNTKWLWDATAGDMIYDESDRCYKLVLNTSEELKNKTFRFVGDHEITKNWYEDDIKANGDYPTSKEGFSDATVADPNTVLYTSDCTEEKIDHNQDIIWNRGAGLWTVRFYINDDKTFHYTITGASKIYIPVIAHMGKLLRTYTSAVDVVPVNDDVQIFAAYSYEKGSKNETGYGDETGTVKLYRIKFIPANQGVVLFAPNSPVADGTKTKMEVVPAYSATVKRYSRNAYDYIEKWAESETKEDIWVFDHNYSEGQNKWNNYMIPVLADTKVTQFYYDENNEWSGRVFSFTRLSQTDAGRGKIVADSEDDYYGFFRAAGNVKASYSYLMLPKTVMTSNGQILGQIQDGSNKKEDIKNFSKSMVWFEGIDAPMDNETTGISELKDNSSNIDAAYYTLQGVKVVKPVKGIYIHQGKKVIVK